MTGTMAAVQLAIVVHLWWQLCEVCVRESREERQRVRARAREEYDRNRGRERV